MPRNRKVLHTCMMVGLLLPFATAQDGDTPIGVPAYGFVINDAGPHV